MCKFMNSPITPLFIIITTLLSLIVYLHFIKNEKVDCNFYLSLNYEEAYKLNWTNYTYQFVEEDLRDNFYFNISFPNHQEALAFEKISFDEINRLPKSSLWRYHFWCGTNRTIEPTKIPDFIKVILYNK